jgi:hypothetical protein
MHVAKHIMVTYILSVSKNKHAGCQTVSSMPAVGGSSIACDYAMLLWWTHATLRDIRSPERRVLHNQPDTVSAMYCHGLEGKTYVYMQTNVCLCCFRNVCFVITAHKDRHPHVRVYKHTCIHTFIHTYIVHTYIHAYIHIYIHTHIHTYMHAYVQMMVAEIWCLKLQILWTYRDTHICVYSKHAYIRTFIYIYIYIYIYTYIHTCMHTYTHTYIHKCMHSHIHGHTNTYIAHTYMHACIHTYIHTYITYIHTYTHTYIHTYTHTYIHTYTHTHT